MVPRIFITGVTGYIAGDALAVLAQTKPEYEYRCLVRTEDKAEQVQKAFRSLSNLFVVLGDLDNSELLQKEAEKADIVLHAADASDHVGAANAIAAGLVKGHSRGRPGYWIHTGGTGILCFWDSRDDFATLGSHSDRQYNDLDGVGELTSLPDDAFHRTVDKIVLDTAEKYGDIVKTCIVCPPTIYGPGRGPCSGRGRQVYEMAKLILEQRDTPIIGKGKACWNNVHVHDLSEVYRLLVEKAAANDTSDELWGAKGYILRENGEHVWSDLARKVSAEAAKLGYTKTPQEDSLSKDEALKQAGFEAVSWGLNSRGQAKRARKYLAWKPKERSIEDEVPDILRQEHKDLASRSA